MAITYLQPSGLQEACDLLSLYGEKAKLLAGGTDLVVNMKKGKTLPEAIIDLSRLKELKAIKETAGELLLGSLVTFTELSSSSVIQSKVPVLAQAAKAVGSPQIRNRGTVGGNIANASPAADVVPALVALDGIAVLVKAGSSREVRLQDLIVGPYRTAVAPDELIAAVRVKVPRPGTGMSFVKVGRRNALAIARLNGTCLLQRTGQRVEQLSLVIGSATPTPHRFTAVEEYVSGQTGSPDVFARAGKLAGEHVLQITGRRASSAYKLPVIENLTLKLLTEAWAKGGTADE